MAVDERRRHEMYLAFEELVGAEVAATMMEHLPPVGWADVATKRDIDLAVTEIRAELHAEIGRLTRWMFTTMLTGILGAVGLAFTAARLA